jgi:hypothetical protein
MPEGWSGAARPADGRLHSEKAACSSVLPRRIGQQALAITGGGNLSDGQGCRSPASTMVRAGSVAIGPHAGAVFGEAAFGSTIQPRTVARAGAPSTPRCGKSGPSGRTGPRQNWAGANIVREIGCVPTARLCSAAMSLSRNGRLEHRPQVGRLGDAARRPSNRIFCDRAMPHAAKPVLAKVRCYPAAPTRR